MPIPSAFPGDNKGKCDNACKRDNMSKRAKETTCANMRKRQHVQTSRSLLLRLATTRANVTTCANGDNMCKRPIPFASPRDNTSLPVACRALDRLISEDACRLLVVLSILQSLRIFVEMGCAGKGAGQSIDLLGGVSIANESESLQALS